MSNSKNKYILIQTHMDQSDIQYVIELLSDSIRDEDWDIVLEAKDFLGEFLNGNSSVEFEE